MWLGGEGVGASAAQAGRAGGWLSSSSSSYTHGPIDPTFHLSPTDLFFAKEMELFNGPGVDRSRYTQLSFKEYCLGPDKARTRPLGVCVCGVDVRTGGVGWHVCAHNWFVCV